MSTAEDNQANSGEPAQEVLAIPDVRGSEPATSRKDQPLAPGLYLVATPIGNLEDITLRALRVLRTVDRIACEDTRQTQKLLNHFGIRKPTVSYHLHNEEGRAGEFLQLLQEGGRLAVVSDAGLPGIADPGSTLVRAATEANIPVYPVPGANAALSALIASGLPTERFTFHGFLPAREGQRRTLLESLRALLPTQEAATHIFYEAPHRILASLGDVARICGSAHPVALARELTKVHEEFLRGPVQTVLAELQARDLVRGELVLLLSGIPAAESISVESSGAALSLIDEITAAMRQGMAEKDALKHVAKRRGLGKSDAYREWQRRRRS